MKNKILDLNNHLFAELERLGKEDMTDEEIEVECKRAQSIGEIAQTIVQTAAIQIKAVELACRVGDPNVPVDKVLDAIGYTEA